LKEIAEKYNLSLDVLSEQANKYEHRPPFIIELAKRRLQTVARLIGSRVECKWAEEALRESKEAIGHAYAELDQIFNTAADGMCVINKEGIILRINNTLCTMLGVNMDEVIGKKCREILRISLCETRMCPIIHFTMSEQPLECDIELHTRGGRKIPCILTVTSLKGPDGTMTGIVEDFKDITERNETEDALRKSEEKYRTLVENSYDMIFIVDVEGNFLFTNKTCETILGYSWEELSQINGFALMHPDDVEITRGRLKKLMSEGKIQTNAEYRYRIKSGSYINILTNAVPIFDDKGKIVATLGIGRDITEIKRIEEALRESEAKYSMVVEKAKDAIVIIQDERYRFANRRAAEILGYSVEELTGKSVWECVEPESEELARSAILGKEVPGVYQINLKCRDGRIKDIEASSTIINYQGKPAMLSVGRDITERKRMEEAMLRAERRYHVLVDNASDAILLADRKGGILDANKKAEELLGYKKAELIHMNTTRLYPRGETERVMCVFSDILLEGSGCLCDSFALRKDGQTVPVDVTGSVIEYGSEKIILEILRDMTDHKKLEEETQKMQKLESLGILAGGIAHDFNNLLAIIIGNLSLLETCVFCGENNVEVLESAKAASWQARSLTQQLLTFSRGGSPVKKIASIAGLVTNSVSFVLSGSKVKCELSLPDDLWWAEVDEGQITQVINNIIINALQAMPQGGTIRASAENIVMRTDGDSGLLPLKRGRFVKISIKDEGGGIPKEYLHKIFDPYFTTKQSGTGLGLAISYSIIKKHNGHISVESQPGAGTAFYIYLPACEKEVLAVKKVGEVKSCPRRRGRILIMDDRQPLRDMMQNMLIDLGYEVESAAEGSEAVDLYKRAKESGQGFEAVILDLTVPGGMGGKETLQNLREIDSEVKAIVASGYSTDPILSDYRHYGFCGAITKPFEIKKLRETLCQVLE